MRRRFPDLSYKRETKDILSIYFEPWQLVVKDPREGFHRFINRIVSFAKEYQNEIKYIESMFFPDAIDISEPYNSYTTYPASLPDYLLIDGSPINEVLPRVSLDEFLAGFPDTWEQFYTRTHSGISPKALSMTDGKSVYVLYDYGKLIKYDIYNDSFEVVVESQSSELITKEVIVDTTEGYCPLYEDAENIVLTTPSGTILAYERVESTGVWNPLFDIDNNKSIGDYEWKILLSAYGKSITTSSPAEWSKYGWADVNGDGEISDVDFESVKSSIPSFDPSIKTMLRITGSYRGSVLVTYTRPANYPVHITMDDIGDIPNTHIPVILQSCIAVAYDNKTDIYYCIDDDVTMRAVSIDPTFETIVGETYITPPLWGTARLIDCDILDGMLYVLMSDTEQTKLAEANIWFETEIVFDGISTIPIEDPLFLGVGRDGIIVVGTESNLYAYNGVRHSYTVIDNATYFSFVPENLTHSYNDIAIVPHTIFNNFDSFAYSLGLLRPPGCDNIWMKRAIYDTFVHRHGLSAIEATYGIMRSLGVIPDTYYSSLSIVLPSQLSFDYPATITLDLVNYEFVESNGVMVAHTDEGDIFSDGFHILFSSSFPSCDSLTINGYFYDGNRDAVPSTYTFSIPFGQPYTNAPVQLYSWRDSVYRNSLSQEFVTETINSMIDSEVTIWKNAKPEQTPLDSLRVNVSPIIPTCSDDPLLNNSLFLDEYDEEVLL